MIDVAAAVPPGPAQTTLVATLSVAGTLLGAYLVYRTGQRANRINDRSEFSKQQLAWTQQAMNEASAAKTEAKAATVSAIEAERAAHAAGVAATQATDRAEAAEVRLTHVSDLTEKLLDWIARVVRKAHAVELGDDTDPQVRELIRAINGGPPEISTTDLRRRGK